VPERLDDIVSDFSVFHRVDDVTALPGPVFFRMAWRLASYQGVMAIRVAEARGELDDSSSGQQQREAPRPRAPAGVVTAGTVDPDLKGIFSFS
jgi:hypothetical protein